MQLPTYGNVLEMIGNTPLMAVRHLDTGPCELFLKLENQNPGGSIKDRVGLYLIEAAERGGATASRAARSSRPPPATPGWASRWWRRRRATACCWSSPTR